MLHEIFLALLGFTGDIIIEKHDTFTIRDGCDLFTLSEREQINKIVVLGWKYKHLSNIVRSSKVLWGDFGQDNNSRSSQSYFGALCLGVEDVLQEYADEVAFLEEFVSSEGPVPLSYLVRDLLKVIT